MFTQIGELDLFIFFIFNFFNFNLFYWTRIPILNVKSESTVELTGIVNEENDMNLILYKVKSFVLIRMLELFVLVFNKGNGMKLT